MANLKINEIFYSIQGEAGWVGVPMAFVRLTGCNLRCAWCDSPFAFEEGSEKSIDEILEEVGRHPTEVVEITGGEPLLQPESVDLMQAFLGKGYRVLLETGGSISMERVPPEVVKVMDIKAPASGEAESLHPPNLETLNPAQDMIKIVLADRADFDFAKKAIAQHGLEKRATIFLQPAHKRLDPAQLSEWIKEELPNARLSVQLHKSIWPGVNRGV